MFAQCLENVRKKKPLIHNITNYVTANDVANIILAIGGSPIMADEESEVEEITSVCNGLNINMGTLNKNTILSRIKAGKKANTLNHPVLLDPVGVGASQLRIQTAQTLLKEVKFSVIRGNISEIKSLIQKKKSNHGVDADIADTIEETNIDWVKKMAKQLDCILVISGAIDLVADEKECYVIHNGRKEMSSITGTGCQLSGLITTFITANPDNLLEASAAAVCAMGLAGEIGYSHLQSFEGNATYRNRIIDAIYHMDGEMLEKGAKYEKY